MPELNLSTDTGLKVNATGKNLKIRIRKQSMVVFMELKVKITSEMKSEHFDKICSKNDSISIVYAKLNGTSINAVLVSKKNNEARRIGYVPKRGKT